MKSIPVSELRTDVISTRFGLRIVAALIVLAAALTTMTVPGMAQAVTSLSGRVTDSTGAVVPHAVVTLVSVTNGSKRETATDGQGD